MKPDQQHIDNWLHARKAQRQYRNPAELLVGLQAGSRAALSAAITLIESENLQDQRLANTLLSDCKKVAKTAKRIGITGVPGVGKSTFIESFGLELIQKGLMQSKQFSLVFSVISKIMLVLNTVSATIAFQSYENIFQFI